MLKCAGTKMGGHRQILGKKNLLLRLRCQEVEIFIVKTYRKGANRKLELWAKFTNNRSAISRPMFNTTIARTWKEKFTTVSYRIAEFKISTVILVRVEIFFKRTVLFIHRWSVLSVRKLRTTREHFRKFVQSNLKNLGKISSISLNTDGVIDGTAHLRSSIIMCRNLSP